MKASLLGNTCTLILSLSFLSACSDGGGGARNANDTLEAQNCEISGSSYGIISGGTLNIGNPLSQSTVLVIHISGDEMALCTGTLVDKNKVLTAAHCTSRSNADRTLIAFSNNIECAAKAKKRTVRTVTAQEIHPSYTYYSTGGHVENATNDLALLKFSGSLPEGYKVRPLPSKSYDTAKATELLMSGYGKTSESAEDSGTLRYTSAAASRLSKSFTMKSTGANYSIDKTLVVQQPNNGVCSGDSGGPLYAKDANGILTLIGVTSMVADNNALKKEDVRACHGISLFVDVRAQLDWIEKSMSKLNY